MRRVLPCVHGRTGNSAGCETVGRDSFGNGHEAPKKKRPPARFRLRSSPIGHDRTNPAPPNGPDRALNYMVGGVSETRRSWEFWRGSLRRAGGRRRKDHRSSGCRDELVRTLANTRSFGRNRTSEFSHGSNSEHWWIFRVGPVCRNGNRIGNGNFRTGPDRSFRATTGGTGLDTGHGVDRRQFQWIELDARPDCGTGARWTTGCRRAREFRLPGIVSRVVSGLRIEPHEDPGSPPRIDQQNSLRRPCVRQPSTSKAENSERCVSWKPARTRENLRKFETRRGTRHREAH